jgi:shikimate dehydrogenase
VISGKTRVFALLGDPVGHSLSPAMQNAAFRALGLDAVYVALRCAGGDVAGLARALAAAGGGGNATVPHKAALAAALTEPSALVRELGAANTFWGEGAALAGDSTDVDGILAALARLDAPAEGWLVIGTGGSARAVAAAAAERGAPLAVRSRAPERAEAFLAWARGIGVDEADPARCRVAINATPLGLAAGDPPPLPPAEAGTVTHALDLVYAAGQTAWVRAWAARGVRAEDGREVLVAQGAGAFRWWYPQVRPPIEVMRAAVARVLG